MTFLEWLQRKGACHAALGWVKAQPDQSVEALWKACERGDWMLWVHSVACTSPEVLAPVAYRAANRAVQYAISALDAAGISHKLMEAPEIIDKETALAAVSVLAGEASQAARCASARAVVWSAVHAAKKAAGWAAEREAALTAWAAEQTARAAEQTAGLVAEQAAELKFCASDCRELLPLPKVNFD